MPRSPSERRRSRQLSEVPMMLVTRTPALESETKHATGLADGERIVIRGRSKTYANGTHGTHALQGIDLEIPLGMFGLLSPNGAGKSTLMRILATLQEADAGSVTFGSIDVLHDKSHMRQQLGYLPQSFGVYPGVSAQQLLDHLATLKGISSASGGRPSKTAS